MMGILSFSCNFHVVMRGGEHRVYLLLYLPFAHFKIKLFVFLLLIFESSLPILYTSPCRIYDMQIFPSNMYLAFLYS